MALNKLTSFDKSRSSSRTETEDTVKPQTKTRSISSASLYDKYTKEQQPKEIMIRNNIISFRPTIVLVALLFPALPP